VEIVSPEQLEYRNRVLRKAHSKSTCYNRRLGVQEFLVRFDLTHPLVQAYRDRAVCVVNSFPLGAGAQEGHVRAADG